MASDQHDKPELDEYFTDDVVNVICSADLSKMKTSLLEEVLNQRKQELLANSEISSLLSALQQQSQDEREDKQSQEQQQEGCSTQSEVPTETAVHRARINPESSQRSQNPTPPYLPIDLTCSAETVNQLSFLLADSRASEVGSNKMLSSSKGGKDRVGTQPTSAAPSSSGSSSSESKSPSSSHISVHPSVYVLNRQTGTSSKTQAKPS